MKTIVWIILVLIGLKILWKLLISGADEEDDEEEEYVPPKRKGPKPISVFQDFPLGFTSLVAREVAVAGISKGSQRKAAKACIEGRDQKVELLKDPDNPHDPNAIRVVAHWRDKRGRWNSDQIGWVPRDLARQIAEEIPDVELSARIRVMFPPGRGRSPGMRIEIARRPKRRGKRK